MSLLSELAVNLRAAGTELPLPEVRRAAHEVDTASRRLAAALIQQPPGVRALSGALEHLDSAAGALLLAQHSLQGYLASVGALRPPVPSTVDTPIPSNWWVERVVELTGHRPGLPGGGTGGSAELLHHAVARALDADRAGLAAVLAGADPATGLGLAALTAPLVRRYADLVDEPRVALATIRVLLPGLPDAVAEAVLTGTRHRPWDLHPADPAIAGTVLVAELLNLSGLNALPER
jgi:hypothetical protein